VVHACGSHGPPQTQVRHLHLCGAEGLRQAEEDGVEAKVVCGGMGGILVGIPIGWGSGITITGSSGGFCGGGGGGGSSGSGICVGESRPQRRLVQ
jgi:hypothetical protein